MDGAAIKPAIAMGTPKKTHITSAALRGTAATSGRFSPMRRADIACTPEEIPCCSGKKRMCKPNFETRISRFSFKGWNQVLSS
jgi:hypothetical protein